jgi:hypothetical protein
MVNEYLADAQEVAFYAASPQIAHLVLNYFNQQFDVLHSPATRVGLSQKAKAIKAHEATILSKLSLETPDKTMGEVSDQMSQIKPSSSLKEGWSRHKKACSQQDQLTRLKDFAWLLRELGGSQQDVFNIVGEKVEKLMLFVYAFLQKLYGDEEQHTANVDKLDDLSVSSIRLEGGESKLKQARDIASFVEQQIDETSTMLRKAKRQKKQAWREMLFCSRKTSFRQKRADLKIARSNLKVAKERQHKLAKTIRRIKSEILEKKASVSVGEFLLKALAQQKNAAINRLFFKDRKFIRRYRTKITKHFFADMAHPVGDIKTAGLLHAILNENLTDILLRNYRFRRNVVKFIDTNRRSFLDPGDNYLLLMRLCENRHFKPSRGTKEIMGMLEDYDKKEGKRSVSERRKSAPLGGTTAQLEDALGEEHPVERRKSESDAAPQFSYAAAVTASRRSGFKRPLVVATEMDLVPTLAAPTPG